MSRALKPGRPGADDPGADRTASSGSPTVEGAVRDQGFTLIEVIVAFGLLLTMVAASLVILSSAQSATRDNSRRTTALNLAARELSITADAFNSGVRGPNTIEVGTVANPSPLTAQDDVGEPLVINNVAYTVQRRATWTSVGSTAESACDEGTTAELAYLRVRVAVSWAGGEDRPVTMTTILTPSKGTYYTDSDGHIGLKVIDRDGKPRAGQAVSISGPESATETTDENGCVLFSFLTAGSYRISLSDAGYVDSSGKSPSTTTAAVVAGQIWKGTVSYDQAATITATLQPPIGYLLPEGLTTTTTANRTPLAIMLGNSGLLPNGFAAATSTTGLSTVVVKNLWPYASGYEVWAGKCLDNDPDFPEYAGGARSGPVTSTPGGVGSVDVPLVGFTVRNSGGSSRAVFAVQTTDSSCSKADTYAGADYGAKVLIASSLGGGATVKTSLPYGTWRIYSANTVTGSPNLRGLVTITPAGVAPVTTPTVSVS